MAFKHRLAYKIVANEGIFSRESVTQCSDSGGQIWEGILKK